jgi:hypothetical protein
MSKLALSARNCHTLDAPPPPSGLVKEVVNHPTTFGVGVGVANAVIAKVRGKPLTARGTLLTVLVLGIGEAILAMDETPAERKGRKPALVGVLSGLGVLVGLAVFTEWKSDAKGGRPVLLTEREQKRASAAA